MVDDRVPGPTAATVIEYACSEPECEQRRFSEAPPRCPDHGVMTKAKVLSFEDRRAAINKKRKKQNQD